MLRPTNQKQNVTPRYIEVIMLKFKVTVTFNTYSVWLITGNASTYFKLDMEVVHGQETTLLIMRSADQRFLTYNTKLVRWITGERYDLQSFNWAWEVAWSWSADDPYWGQLSMSRGHTIWQTSLVYHGHIPIDHNDGLFYL